MSSSRSLDSMSNSASTLVLGIIALLLIHTSAGQDIYFPGKTATPVHQRINLSPKSTTPSTPTAATATATSASTTPTLITTTGKSEPKCSENMQLEKEENSTETFCECVPGYLYHLKLDNCYKQYTKGPCLEGQHFILRNNATKARCVRNPCSDANTVMYKGSCHGLLLSGGPCKPNETLLVPDTSNEPVCAPVGTAVYQVITAPVKRCGPGSRRAGRGKCREIL